jgi:5-methylcytosine-specific restriction endonuclease McrA
MTWENFGDWHVDHRVPLASFNYASADDPEFRAAWALTNLQPLWKRENLRKGKLMKVLL